ncbi:hemerythrin [Azospirillum rugosum]|uniref:Hemerythrin n=2 Tax=Azospirillum rugosum TaxID=416170 RepID=A0ABS4SG93_9PROT|nr:hemerythrin [Azospirillum rugosum]MDQ0527931.1 hemerythrin [Azospirillum rugosum]
MSVGVAVLDDDHRKLIDMFNGLLKTGIAEKDRESLSGLLGGLNDYTKVHFAREEDLMERQGYPNLEQHRAAHRYFIDEVQKLCQDNDDSNEMMLRIDLILLLKEWLIEHIQNVDAQYTPFMADTAH